MEFTRILGVRCLESLRIDGRWYWRSILEVEFGFRVFFDDSSRQFANNEAQSERNRPRGHGRPNPIPKGHSGNQGVDHHSGECD